MIGSPLSMVLVSGKHISGCCNVLALSFLDFGMDRTMYQQLYTKRCADAGPGFEAIKRGQFITSLLPPCPSPMMSVVLILEPYERPYVGLLPCTL